MRPPFAPSASRPRRYEKRFCRVERIHLCTFYITGGKGRRRREMKGFSVRMWNSAGSLFIGYPIIRKSHRQTLIPSSVAPPCHAIGRIVHQRTRLSRSRARFFENGAAFRHEALLFGPGCCFLATGAAFRRGTLQSGPGYHFLHLHDQYGQWHANLRVIYCLEKCQINRPTDFEKKTRMKEG